MSKIRNKSAIGLPTRRGTRTHHFNPQLLELDKQILDCKAKVGVKKFLDKADLRAAYNRTKGRCSFCGIPLLVAGSEAHMPHFMFLRPIKLGGKVEQDNLLVVCFDCKGQHHESRRDQPRELLYDFNTIPDLIQRLVEETIELSKCSDEYIRLYQDSVKRIKRQLNYAIHNFVHTLAYNPRADAIDIKVERRIEEQNTAADLIAKIAQAKEEVELTPLRLQLINLLKEINLTKRYAVVRY